MKDLNSKSKNEILRSVGESIRGARISQELTMQELAYKSEVSLMNLSRIENGATNPTLLTLIRIFKALGKEKEIMKLFPEPTLSPIYLSRLAKKQKSNKLPQRVRKKKVVDYMLRKGFESDIVWACVHKL